MGTNLTLSADLLTFSEDILDVKLGGKILFFAECWFIKNTIFVKRRTAEKLIVIFAFVFEVYLFQIWDSKHFLISTMKALI